MASGFLDVRRLGETEYADAHALQEELVGQRIAGGVGDTLLLTHHRPVVTVGRGTREDVPSDVSVPIVEVERGGEATYHGPGQLVAYPILELPPERRDLHAYLRDLEEVVIRILAEVDIVGERSEGRTGVWVQGKKIASIGVAVRRWVTWHGFALNLQTDLDAFRAFRPCGLDPDVMTRLADWVELPPNYLLFEVLTVKHLCDVFGLELPPPPVREQGSDGGLPILPG